jgi:hypothetical protein
VERQAQAVKTFQQERYALEKDDMGSAWPSGAPEEVLEARFILMYIFFTPSTGSF